MCVSPVILKNDNPKIHQVYKTNVVPCGKCFECMQSRQSSWRFRLLEQLKIADNSYFLTLTYDDECITYSDDGLQNLDYSDLQRMFKRYRSRYFRKYNTKSRIKYFAVGEYGEKSFRPHYHLILFDVELPLLLECWNLGMFHVGDVNESSITYTLKYCLKRSFKVSKSDLRVPEKALISKGIGSNYLTPEMVQYHKDDINRNAKYYGKDVNLPRYYRDKIFSDREKVKRYLNIVEKTKERKLNQSFRAYVIDRNEKLLDKLKKTN